MPNTKLPVTIANALTGLPIEEMEPPPGGGGFTSFTDTGAPVAIGVPLGDDDTSLAVRCHEYGHLILRDTQHETSASAYPDAVRQAVMDVHTNAWLIAHKVPAVAHLPLSGPGRVRDERVNLTDRILCAYRSYGLNEPPPVRLPRPLRKRVVLAQRMAARAKDSAELLAACNELQAILNDPDPDEGPQPPPKPGGMPGGCGGIPGGMPGDSSGSDSGSDSESDSASSARASGSYTPPTDTLLRTLQKLAQSTKAREKKKLSAKQQAEADSFQQAIQQAIQQAHKQGAHPLQGKSFDPEKPEWMTMQVARPRLERRLQSARDYGRATRPSYAGSFRFPLRALPVIGDGKVFGSVARGKRGTILIDFSGSMELAESDILTILKACPHMQVATYCGDARENHGELRIVARHGRVAEEVTRYGGANGIDGPALDWLAQQPGPRIWICDGLVTGLEDSSSEILKERCDKIARAHAIKRFPTLKAFLNPVSSSWDPDPDDPDIDPDPEY